MKTELLGQPSPFFNLIEIAASEVDRCPSAIGRLREGVVTGIVVRGVYSSEIMQRTADRLERHEPPFLKTWFPEKFRSWFYGQNLNLMQTDPETYFQEAKKFHRHMRELLPEPDGIEGRVMKLLSALDGRRPYRSAPGPDLDQTYMLTTFRGHGEGGYIAAHCDNEQALRPAYEHLQTLVSSHMYSMVLVIGQPEAGGALEVFDYRVEPEHARLLSDDSVRQKPDLNRLSSVSFSLNSGDMIVLDSGRYLHRVTPVIGGTTRWTACSFMAHARDRQAVYCWG